LPVCTVIWSNNSIPVVAPRRRNADPGPESSRPVPHAAASIPGCSAASLERDALSTGMARGVHPTRLKQLGRHKSYAVLDGFLEPDDPFENHPLNVVL
jgi:hypothetical protein